jgi:hypothetical protein
MKKKEMGGNEEDDDGTALPLCEFMVSWVSPQSDGWDLTVPRLMRI